MHNRLRELLPFDAVESDIVIESSLAGCARELLMRVGFAEKKLLIVCDESTHTALGHRLTQELAFFKTELLMLRGTPRPDVDTLEYVSSRPSDALVAVGSGTINDICKYVSFMEKKPYAVFPTAPSMNGYLSANASIEARGLKITKPAHLPKGVFCDLSVLAKAPKRLILSGLGDSLCRATAQADWLLSHLLLDTPYNPLPFELLKPYEDELFSHADRLASGYIRSIELLIKTLLVSGLGMTIAGGSYPASQGEHLIAHTMEMKHGSSLQQAYHGEEIGVTTLTMAKLQEELLSRPLFLPKRLYSGKVITAYFGAARADAIMEASRNKYLLRERHGELQARLHKHDAEIRDAIRKVSLPEARLREILTHATAPTTAADLGWSERDYDLAVFHARFIRDRFTFLDLL